MNFCWQHRVRLIIITVRFLLFHLITLAFGFNSGGNENSNGPTFFGVPRFLSLSISIALPFLFEVLREKEHRSRLTSRILNQVESRPVLRHAKSRHPKLRKLNLEQTKSRQLQSLDTQILESSEI